MDFRNKSIKLWLRFKRFFMICTPLWAYDGKAASYVEGVWRIYNETPIRQNRGFFHYGESLAVVAASLKLPLGDAKYPDSRRCDRCVLQCTEKHIRDGFYRLV